MPAADPLRTLAYTSRATRPLGEDELYRLYKQAATLNALDGITGLLVYNGAGFLQVVEGASSAIEALLARLRRDDRHTGIAVADDRRTAARCFPSWDMKALTVDGTCATAIGTIMAALPAGLDQAARERVRAMAALIRPQP